MDSVIIQSVVGVLTFARCERNVINTESCKMLFFLPFYTICIKKWQFFGQLFAPKNASQLPANFPPPDGRGVRGVGAINARIIQNVLFWTPFRGL